MIQRSIYEVDLLRKPADTNSKKVEWKIGKASVATISEMDICWNNAAIFGRFLQQIFAVKMSFIMITLRE